MLQSDSVLYLGLTALLPFIYAYPQDTGLVVTRADQKPKFIIGAIGDSWASGVTYAHLPGNNYDENKDGCMRYKYAWSTVANDNYSKWGSNTGMESEFEFKACSGAHLESMKDQMDKLSRPKLVLMEVGGNNADFYPLADSCLFNATYGKKREIGKVRDRLTGENMDKFQENIRQTIHTCRGHGSAMGNDAALLVLDYAKFFALDKVCDGWTFNVYWTNKTQNVVSGMRKEINSLPSKKPQKASTAKKIQYINIDPTFEGHRFCERGHSWFSQINYNNNVWTWNNPTRIFVTITMGKDVKTYDPNVEPPPLWGIVDQLMQHRDGDARIDGEFSVVTFRDLRAPDISMEWKVQNLDSIVGPANGGGSIPRTLHPTQPGHQAMGDIVVQHLQQIYKDPAW